MTTGFRAQSDGIPVIDKALVAVLDYPEDWSAWLATGETISSITTTADTGLTVMSSLPDPTNKIVNVWLSGGVNDTTYLVSVRITTSAGRTDQRSFRVAVKLR
jgi:hypothetical protein